MNPEPRTLIAALRRSHQRLASLVHAMSEDFLSSRSYCADWSVAQVLSHLGSGAEIALLSLGAALRKEPMDRDAFPAIWDTWNNKSPAQQAADSLPADEAHIGRLEALTGAELDGIDLDFFGMKLDASGMIRLRLSEHAMHTWDVAAAIDPQAVLDPRAVALLTERLPWVAERTGRPGGQPFRARLRGTGPDIDLLLDVADTVTVAPWPGDAAAADGAPAPGAAAGAPGAEIRMPAEALMRLVYGRLDPVHTPPAEVTGGEDVLDRVRAVFPGF